MKSPRREGIDRLERREHAHLVVEGTAPPHEAVGDVAREGRVRPRALRSRLHGNDIEVRHHDDGLERGVRARPLEEETRGIDDLVRERRVGAREALREIGVQRTHGDEVGARVLPRDGGKSDRSRQMLGDERFVHRRQQRARARLARARSEAHRAHGDRGHEHHQQGGQRRRDLLHAGIWWRPRCCPERCAHPRAIFSHPFPGEWGRITEPWPPQAHRHRAPIANPK